MGVCVMSLGVIANLSVSLGARVARCGVCVCLCVRICPKWHNRSVLVCLVRVSVLQITYKAGSNIVTVLAHHDICNIERSGTHKWPPIHPSPNNFNKSLSEGITGHRTPTAIVMETGVHYLNIPDPHTPTPSPSL